MFGNKNSLPILDAEMALRVHCLCYCRKDLDNSMNFYNFFSKNKYFLQGFSNPPMQKKTKEEKRKSIILRMVYICSSFWLLAVGSRDLSQAEKKVTVVKPEQIYKMAIFSYSKWSKVVIFSENSCHFLNLLYFGNSYFLPSLR